MHFGLEVFFSQKYTIFVIIVGIIRVISHLKIVFTYFSYPTVVSILI
jgi:hypothetical protein